jgi:hypothetical protein
MKLRDAIRECRDKVLALDRRYGDDIALPPDPDAVRVVVAAAYKWQEARRLLKTVHHTSMTCSPLGEAWWKRYMSLMAKENGGGR